MNLLRSQPAAARACALTQPYVLSLSHVSGMCYEFISRKACHAVVGKVCLPEGNLCASLLSQFAAM